jgi:hypothetical protein
VNFLVDKLPLVNNDMISQSKSLVPNFCVHVKSKAWSWFVSIWGMVEAPLNAAADMDISLEVTSNVVLGPNAGLTLKGVATKDNARLLAAAEA